MGNPNIDSAEVVFTKRTRCGWNCIFCRFVWTIAVPVYLLAVLWLVGVYAKGAFASFLEPLIRLTASFDLFPIYLTFGCIAIAGLALKLCLHDLVTRRGGETVVISNDRIERKAKSSILSVATTAPPGLANVYLPAWRADRSAIKKIIVRMHDKVDSSTLQIYYDKGVVWLALSEWIHPHEEGSRDVLQNLKNLTRQMTPDDLQAMPLISEMIKRGYPVEFQKKNAATFERSNP